MPYRYSDRGIGRIVKVLGITCLIPVCGAIAQEEWRDAVVAPGTRIAGQGWALTMPALGSWMQLGTAQLHANAHGGDGECLDFLQSPGAPRYGTPQVVIAACALTPAEDLAVADPAEALLAAELANLHETAVSEKQAIQDERKFVLDRGGRKIYHASYRIRWALAGNVPIYDDLMISCPPDWQPGQLCFRVEYTRYAPTKDDPGAAVAAAFLDGLSID